MRRLLVVIAAPLLAAAGFGCSDQLPPATRIDKMRLLAVRAEPPEIADGQSTRLDALVAQPFYGGGAAPSLSYLWLACRQAASAQVPAPCGITALGNGGPDALGPASDGGAPTGIADCASDRAAALCLLGTGPQASFAPALDGANAVSQLLVTLVVADEGEGSALACARAAAASGTGAPPDVDHCTIAVKRLSVAQGSVPSDQRNANPHLSAFTLDGAAFTDGAARVPRAAAGASPATLPLEAVRCASTGGLSAACPQGSFAQPKPDGSWEVLYVSWYATAGTPQQPRSSYGKAGCSGECLDEGGERARVGWTAPDAAEAALRAPGGAVRFWAVVRDDRGGVGWLDGSAAIE